MRIKPTELLAKVIELDNKYPYKVYKECAYFNEDLKPTCIIGAAFYELGMVDYIKELIDSSDEIDWNTFNTETGIYSQFFTDHLFCGIDDINQFKAIDTLAALQTSRDEATLITNVNYREAD